MVGEAEKRKAAAVWGSSESDAEIAAEILAAPLISVAPLPCVGRCGEVRGRGEVENPMTNNDK